MTEQKVFGIFHIADVDGWMCREILRYAHRNNPYTGELQLIPWNYGYDPEPLFEMIGSDDMVYMMDVSLPGPVMERLAKHCKFVWIDHHKSQFDSFDIDLLESHLLDSRYSAAELTWRYFFQTPIPISVQITGAYDCRPNEFMAGRYMETYDHIYNPGSRDYDRWNDVVIPTQVYFNTFMDDGETLWNSLDWEPGDSKLPIVISKGNDMLRFERQQMKILTKFTQDVEFMGRRMAVLNAFVNPSRMFDVIASNLGAPDILLQYYRRPGGEWKYSIRSRRESVVDIAQCYGGNGLDKSAGFVLDAPPMFNEDQSVMFLFKSDDD